MKGIERFIVVAALVNTAIYLPYFLAMVAFGGFESHPLAIFPWHFVGMFLNLLAFVITIRDLYLRPFANPSSKITWCLLILCTGGIGWLVYVFKHGLKPRPPLTDDGTTHQKASLPRYSLKTLLAVVTLVGCLLGLYANRDAIPGTYHTDENGFPRGTGVTEYRYDNGALMIREWYFRGLVYRATWFTPDGHEIATETYDKETGGTGYFLRQDGSIRSRHTFKYSPKENDYLGSGRPLYYDRTGVPIPEAKHPID